MAVYSVFTKEATEEARKIMHPKYSKSVWYESVTNNKIAYRIMMDATVSIYNATLK